MKGDGWIIDALVSEQENAEAGRATGHTRPLCDGCGCEIDPDVCSCGDMKDGHNDYDAGHAFVPAGCTCFYSS